MSLVKHGHDAVHLFIKELACRVVAESGIPSDQYHLGKMIFRSLKDAPDFILQIDGAQNASETNASGLLRSIKCAIGLQNLGVKTGDVMVLMGPNHVDLAIPLYAALYLGVAVAALDASLGIQELKNYFAVDEPKVVFCQSEKYSTVQEALRTAGIEAKVVTFNTGAECVNFNDFLNNSEETAVAQFRPADFDPDETIAFLTSTSGTTGVPKSTILTHKSLSVSLPYLWLAFSKFPTPTQVVMVVSPLQWLSAGFNYLCSPLLRFTRLQSSKPLTPELFNHLVNKYKPTYIAISPPLLRSLVKSHINTECDLNCFEDIFIGGSAVPQNLIDEIKAIIPGARSYACYGLSEIGGLAFYNEFAVRGSVGRPVGCLEYRLVDPTTMGDICEPNVQGELWLRGLPVGKGYHKNPEATAEAYLKDGWFRTGDIFYRDEHWNFYFVERLKLLLKYKNHQISPIELEAVIRLHPGVLDVAVVGLPDPDDGDLPVACVVARPNYDVTAQEIKHIVKESLTDTKQLRGGVVFMDELPMTVTTKVHRQKLREMVANLNRE